jgi:stringent starvation protein B
MDVTFPVHAVLAIYAKENGQGMVFGDGDTEPTPPKPDKPNLRIVK